MPTVIDCSIDSVSTISAGYGLVYERFIDTFRMLAHSKDPIPCENVPMCWYPLVRYLGHPVVSTKMVLGVNWDGDRLDWPSAYDQASDKRTIVEISSTCRPELVHALFQVDNEWPCPRREINRKEFFVVTNNGSFFRPEVLEYLRVLLKFEPPAKNIIITPCFADKPYPSHVQKLILDQIDRSKWYLASATGVLGICPEPLWAFAPKYDSGIPNLDRCRRILSWFFSKYKHDRVVVYSDFYATAIKDAWNDSGSTGSIEFLFGDCYRTGYESLDYVAHLYRLLETVVKT